MLALILPNLTISPQQSRLMVKYSLSRLNLQMTLMASKCWSRSSFRLTQSPTASSSVLNQRHTMATTLFDIELLDSQLNKIEEEMTDIMKFNDSVIMTIPGIGYINGGMILGEIGNIHRFSSPGKLLAFAGLDTSVYQSGNFQACRTKRSKRGSQVLRYALINAALNIVKNNATFKTYYDVKMAEGRTHYNALGHCASMLIRVIWKVMTNDLEFNLH